MAPIQTSRSKEPDLLAFDDPPLVDDDEFRVRDVLLLDVGGGVAIAAAADDVRAMMSPSVWFRSSFEREPSSG